MSRVDSTRHGNRPSRPALPPSSALPRGTHIFSLYAPKTLLLFCSAALAPLQIFELPLLFLRLSQLIFSKDAEALQTTRNFPHSSDSMENENQRERRSRNTAFREKLLTYIVSPISIFQGKKKEEGNAAKYITRTKAIRYLQINLSTFRCSV